MGHQPATTLIDVIPSIGEVHALQIPLLALVRSRLVGGGRMGARRGRRRRADGTSSTPVGHFGRVSSNEARWCARRHGAGPPTTWPVCYGGRRLVRKGRLRWEAGLRAAAAAAGLLAVRPVGQLNGLHRSRAGQRAQPGAAVMGGTDRREDTAHRRTSRGLHERRGHHAHRRRCAGRHTRTPSPGPTRSGGS
jgi:hypothetical protein